MRASPSGTRLALLVLVGCALVPGGVDAAESDRVRDGSIFRDPYHVEALTSPAPNRRWVPDAVLPALPAPGPAALPPELRDPLSLAQLTDLALRLNPRTRQAWFAARVEAAVSGAERSDEWPQISGLYTYRHSRIISGTTGVPANPSIQIIQQPTVSLSYTLFDFGQRAADKEATSYRLLAANLTQNRVLQEVVFQVEQAYFRVLGTEQLLNANRGSLKSFETALDAARRRHQSGLATIADVFRAETQVAQALLVTTRTEGEVSKARGLLSAAVGLPVDAPLRLQTVSELPPVSRVVHSMDALIAQAKANRPDLVAAEARARAAKATSKSIARAGLPSVELIANYGRVLYVDGREAQDVYAAGFNIRIPIFSGFRDTYNVRRSEALANQAESVRDQLVSQTEVDVWQSYFDLQTAATGVQTAANFVTSANQSAVAAAARYAMGVGSLLDVITSATDDTNARVQQIQSQLDWHLALARLNFALGAIIDVPAGPGVTLPGPGR